MGVVATLSRGERDGIWSKLADPIDCDLKKMHAIVHIYRVKSMRARVQTDRPCPLKIELGGGGTSRVHPLSWRVCSMCVCVCVCMCMCDDKLG